MAQHAEWLPSMSWQRKPERARSQSSRSQATGRAVDAGGPGSDLSAGTQGMEWGADAWLDMPERRAWKPPAKRSVAKSVLVAEFIRQRRASDSEATEGDDTTGSGWQEKVRNMLAARRAQERQADPVEWQGERHAWKPPEKPGAAALSLFLKLAREQEGSDTQAAEEEESVDDHGLAWQEGAKLGPEDLPSDTDSSSEGSFVPSPALRDIARRKSLLGDRRSRS